MEVEVEVMVEVDVEMEVEMAEGCNQSGVGGGIVGGVDREVDGLVGRRAGAMGGGCVRWQGPGAVALLLVVCAALLPVCLEASLEAFKYSTRLVRTKYGPLRGLLLQQPPVEAFLGVPYATPPTGALRYMPPVTPSMWRTPRLADAFSPVCPQRQPDISNRSEALLRLPRGRLAHLERLLPLLLNQSEDCLYLNIYVPRTELFQYIKI
ncbi:neuroligin-1-like [Nilaparvata lugens]|uniref:neuroligin-1-like n=1 Tax=Nilaparvata lugens TaxID=108931 RepID=UPI00193DC138|nr:neuroligin-1-like [Nilaparvata lugens]